MMKNIPPHWKKVKFKELAKEKSVRVDNPGESGYDIYVGLEHLDSGGLVVKRHGSTSDVTSTMKLFSKNDILFARRNTYLRRVSVAPFDGVCSGDIIVLEPILEHIVEDFLPIYMQFEDFENRIIALSAGAFSKRIKWKQLAEEEVVIPSIEEQKKIVEILWAIEDNAAKNEKLIEGAEKFKKDLFSELITKGIGKNTLKQTSVGTVPEKWEVVKVHDIFEVITGTTPSTKEESFWFPQEINWYTPLDLGRLETDIFLADSNKKISLEGLEKTNLRQVPKDTVLISTRAPVGYVGITTTNATINQGCKAIIPREKESSEFYANYFVHSRKRLESFSGGSTFKELTKKSLEEFQIIHPSF